MPRLAAVFAAVLAAALTLPLGAAASRTLTIRLISVTASFSPHDIGPTGPSKGDRYAGTSRLLNRVAQFGKPKGAIVGRDRATLVFLTAKTARTVGVATLPGGTVSFRRTGPLAPTTRVTVVGGTGRYAGARGALSVSVRGDTTLSTYTLRLPSPK